MMLIPVCFYIACRFVSFNRNQHRNGGTDDRGLLATLFATLWPGSDIDHAQADLVDLEGLLADLGIQVVAMETPQHGEEQVLEPDGPPLEQPPEPGHEFD